MFLKFFVYRFPSGLSDIRFARTANRSRCFASLLRCHESRREERVYAHPGRAWRGVV